MPLIVHRENDHKDGVDGREKGRQQEGVSIEFEEERLA